MRRSLTFWNLCSLHARAEPMYVPEAIRSNCRVLETGHDPILLGSLAGECGGTRVRSIRLCGPAPPGTPQDAKQSSRVDSILRRNVADEGFVRAGPGAVEFTSSTPLMSLPLRPKHIAVKSALRGEDTHLALPSIAEASCRRPCAPVWPPMTQVSVPEHDYLLQRIPWLPPPSLRFIL